MDDVTALETGTCILWMRDDGIIEARIKPGASLTIRDGMEILEASKRLAGGRRSPILNDCTQIGRMEKACRDFFAGDEASSFYTAIAILVGSDLSRAVGSFLLGMSMPKAPTRMFDEKERALVWLGMFLTAP